MRKKLPTLILRAVTSLSAAVGALICIFALPNFSAAIAENFPDYAFWQYPVLVGLYAAAICFYFALFHFWRLLNGVDRERRLSVKNLKAIRFSAIAFSVLYFLSAMPVIYLFAEVDDAPGAILIGAFLGALPIGVAAVATILERIASDKQEERQGSTNAKT